MDTTSGDPRAGDGNGWVTCELGHRHWGLFGAAGVLLTDGARVLLQHRAAWTHEGDSWAVPGGARDSHETPAEAALREATEETSLDPAGLTAFGEWVDDHGGWSYTTILAVTPDAVEVRATNPESIDVAWWPIERVDSLRLHRGFAAAWPVLRGLVLDAPSDVLSDGTAIDTAIDTADDTADAPGPAAGPLP